MHIIKVYNEDIKKWANLKFDSYKKDRGDSWSNASEAYLVRRVNQELVEFFQNPSEKEAGDVLNFLSMILANKYGNNHHPPNRDFKIG